MGLRVRAKNRCGGKPSDRSYSDKSVHGITKQGPCWAVDAKVENSRSRQLREGSIVRYWATHRQAEADAALIARGKLFYTKTLAVDTSTQS
jgi:hypothetical protein